MMKSVQEQLSTYKSLHLNKKNVATHFFGIPLIIWSVALLLSLISMSFNINDRIVPMNGAMLIFFLIFLYYIQLQWRLAVGFLVFIVPLVYSTYLLVSHEHVVLIAMIVFIVGWLFQLIGHYYEKAKPAFVDDLNQLLIGPFFLIAEIYFLLGLEKKLETEVSSMAIEKRRAYESKN